jgi:hypothetical protein
MSKLAFISGASALAALARKHEQSGVLVIDGSGDRTREDPLFVRSSKPIMNQNRKLSRKEMLAARRAEQLNRGK